MVWTRHDSNMTPLRRQAPAQLVLFSLPITTIIQYSRTIYTCRVMAWIRVSINVVALRQAQLILECVWPSVDG